MRKQLRWLAVMGVLALVAAACGDDDGDGGGDGGGETITPAITYDAIGEGEGALELIAWHGYTEDGTTEGFESIDWVTPFEEESGCDINVTYADSSDEMVTLMRQGEGAVYDGVSASGDASNRLIVGGDVGAVDPTLFPEMANVIAPLNPDGGTNTDHYIVDGSTYGVPYMYGPNFLMYNTEVVTPAPDELGHHVRGGLAVRRVTDRVRLADLHRRRRDVPDVDEPGPRDHRPVRARSDAVRCGGGPAEATGPDDRQLLGAVHGRDRRVRERIAWWPGPLGR